jgi:hypothetical protein
MDRSGKVRKISPAQVLDPRTVQPVASRYPGPRLSRHILIKASSVKFHEISSCGSRAATCGRNVGCVEAKSAFGDVCEKRLKIKLAYAPSCIDHCHKC